ncbi:SemiSWEET transporter [Paraferrimonas sedimenticola]|uniref:SemiSWEET transporter n=1 Tax=Paraferrimonas sedimenticola TaxID=375674 RepID=UPI000BA8D530|nr:SemiSWEET transporter [Paraferrimonas sedimenticola]
MVNEVWIGYLAAICTTTAFVPQVVHTFKTKDTSSISLGMYILFVVGIALWLSYGVLLDDWPIIIANTITLVLASFILTMKLQEVFKR